MLTKTIKKRYKMFIASFTCDVYHHVIKKKIIKSTIYRILLQGFNRFIVKLHSTFNLSKTQLFTCLASPTEPSTIFSAPESRGPRSNPTLRAMMAASRNIGDLEGRLLVRRGMTGLRPAMAGKSQLLLAHGVDCRGTFLPCGGWFDMVWSDVSHDCS